MKTIDRIIAGALVFIAVIFAAANIMLLHINTGSGKNRPYIVEISRVARSIEQNGIDSVDISGCTYVTKITEYGEDFYISDSDYAIREINGTPYRFDYQLPKNQGRTQTIIIVNVMLTAMSALLMGVLIFVRIGILKPFDRLSTVPYELSKGNLTAPLKESKGRYFGKFIWGIDLLREKLEQQKQSELKLRREKKMLLLSLSHDIKTPLSAIKLYAKALSKGLYSDPKKQAEVAESINSKANEIEQYVNEITAASRDDFMKLEVNMGEFYLSDIMNSIRLYYTEKMELVKTKLTIGEFDNCLLKGDPDRVIEVIQNLVENALKYGDKREIFVDIGYEDDCVLLSVRNKGCTLTDAEIVHIFDSFWRGSNADNVGGSGLGLYICRQLVNAMNGEIFAQLNDGEITVTAVLVKA